MNRTATVCAVVLTMLLTSCSGPRSVPEPVTSSPAAAPAVTPAAPAVTPAAADDTTAGRVEFDVRDAAGRPLTWAQFRDVQSNGAGDDGYDDVIVDSATLQVRDPWPLEPGTGTFAVQRPAGHVTLAMAWPTSHGYGQLLLDLPGPGHYDLAELAAGQAATELETELRERPWYRPSTTVTAARDRAQRAWQDLQGTADPVRRGALAVAALDAFVDAQLQVQVESGRQRAATTNPVVGVTFDDPSRHDALASVAALGGRGGDDTWVRYVFDVSEDARDHVADVAAARAAGLHVLGQFLDSSQLAGVSDAQWQARVAEYVRVLPDVEEWEVGNEVNGAWTGPASAARTRWAASYVKTHSSARTLVTLYWEMGEGEPEESVFSWAAANLPLGTVGDVDDLGLSIYPEEHPLGASLARVLRTLHATYPTQRLLVTELGYGAEDLQHLWWWGSATDTGAGRVAVAQFYSAAVLGAPGAVGGTFWWYYLQDALPPSPVWTALVQSGNGSAGARVRRGRRTLR